ncbi:hypothetical protein ACOSQ4_001108 [Xanthoceras sorbifolium]
MALVYHGREGSCILYIFFLIYMMMMQLVIRSENEGSLCGYVPILITHYTLLQLLFMEGLWVSNDYMIQLQLGLRPVMLFLAESNDILFEEWCKSSGGLFKGVHSIFLKSIAMNDIYIKKSSGNLLS